MGCSIGPFRAAAQKGEDEEKEGGQGEREGKREEGNGRRKRKKGERKREPLRIFSEFKLGHIWK